MKAIWNNVNLTRRRLLTLMAQSTAALTLSTAYSLSQSRPSHATVTYQPGIYYFSDWNPELDPRNAVDSQRLYFLGNNWYSGIRENLTEPGPFSYGPVPDREPLLGWYDDRQQSVMDQQILEAASRGLDHFAFYYYWNMYGGGLENSGQEAIHNFTTSPNKSLLHFYISFVSTGNWPGSDWNTLIVPQLVSFIQDPQYKKTPDGRPILSMISVGDFRNRIGGDAALHTALQQLRNAVQAVGLPNPFLLSAESPNPGDVTPGGFDGFIPFPGSNNNASGYGPVLGNGISQFNYRPWLAGGGYSSGDLSTVDDSGLGVISTPSTPNNFRSGDLAAAKNLLDSQSNALGIATFYAWNETGEGGMIQPSTYFGYGFANAIQDVFGLSNTPYKNFIAAHSLPDLDPPVRLEFAPDKSWHVTGENTTVSGYISNKTGAAISGNVACAAPAGWSILSSSGTTFTNLASGNAQSVSFTFSAGSGNLWGKNTFTLTATYGGSQTVSTTTFEVLTPPVYGLIKPLAEQKTSGATIPLKVRVRNYTSGQSLSGSYTITPPSGWSVSNGSGSISSLGANSVVDLTGPVLTIPSGITQGYYDLNLTVTVGGNSYPSTLRVKVYGDTRWNWDNGTDGWTGGYNNNFNAVYSSGTTAPLVSPSNLGINAASNQHVRIMLLNVSASSVVQFAFATTSSPGFDNAKSVFFLTTPQTRTLQVIDLDMSVNPFWTGTVQQVQIVPTGSPFALKAVYITGSGDIALEKSAIASGFHSTSEAPGRAVDGTLGLTAKWTSDISVGNKWLQIDLGQTYSVNRWAVRHAGAGGESMGYNTADYQFQYYNGNSWSTIDSVTGNTANSTDRSLITPVNAQLVRLYITNPNQGIDSVARIHEFEVYGLYPTVNGVTGQSVPDGGFETPTTASYIYNPTGTPWTFSTGSGVTTNGSLFNSNNPNAPEGSQVAFIQGTGTISQTLSLSAGRYALSFQAAQRIGGGTTSGINNQDFEVRVDGQLVGTFQPSSSSYSSYTTNSFQVTTGNHTLQFLGLDSLGGDRTVFIDAVTLNPLGIQDSGFESPATASYVYRPSGSPWCFLGGTGVTTNGSGFTSNNPSAPEGSQVAFIQGMGSISQAVLLGAGNYTISFKAAQRIGGGSTSGSNSQDFQVRIDGQVVGTFQPSSSNYATYTTNTFSVSAGHHILQFVGLDSVGGDQTVFLDTVAINAQ